MTTLSSNSSQMLNKPGCFMQDKNNHVNKPFREKLLPGSLVYDIVNAKYKPEPERPPFYVQTKKIIWKAWKETVKKWVFLLKNQMWKKFNLFKKNVQMLKNI